MIDSEPSIHFQYYKSPFGELKIASFKEELVICDWRYRKQRETVDKRISKALKVELLESDSKIIQQTIHQLTEYFNNTRTLFELPIQTIGTEFQQSVWKALQTIPFGKTESYLGLSRKLGNEKAIRAVASANGANAISILIPCHRIIGSNGELTGYAGGLPAKKKLLELENPNLYPEQLNLF